MKSQRGKQTITIHILQNISRSKGNQTAKFGQQNATEKLFPDPFLKSQNWAYLWINIFTGLFLLYAKFSSTEIYWN